MRLPHSHAPDAFSRSDCHERWKGGKEAMSRADDDLVRSLVEIAEKLGGRPFASRKLGEDEVRLALREGRILTDPPWAFTVPRPGGPADEADRWITEVADDMQEG